MLGAQRQTQRETLKLFRDTPVWGKSPSIAVSTRKRKAKPAAHTKRDSTPALLAKEQDCCNRATD